MSSRLPPAIRNLPAVVYVGLIYGFIFLPVAVLVLFSFQDSRVPVPPFNGPSLKWYAAVFSDSRMMDALGHSVFVALVSSLASVVLGFFAAYALARHRIPAAGLIQGFLTAPLTVSYLIIAMVLGTLAMAVTTTYAYDLRKAAGTQT